MNFLVAPRRRSLLAAGFIVLVVVPRMLLGYVVESELATDEVHARAEVSYRGVGNGVASAHPRRAPAAYYPGEVAGNAREGGPGILALLGWAALAFGAFVMALGGVWYALLGGGLGAANEQAPGTEGSAR